MARVGFDNDKYLELQSKNIKDRIARFGGKLYLEFGGKLFDDYHASRVLPGFMPDSKLRMLLQLKEEAEVDFSPLELLFPKELPVFDKYDEYLPEELVRKGFACGVLDIEGMKARIREMGNAVK